MPLKLIMFHVAGNKPSLDRNEFNVFAPVSDINCVSKLVEKIVANQIKYLMLNSCISNNCRSVFNTGHSTETAL